LAIVKKKKQMSKRKNRKVHLSKIKAQSDKLAFYKGTLFETKEDLKKMPTWVTLKKLGKVKV